MTRDRRLLAGRAGAGLLVLALAQPRIYGPSWYAITAPFSLREQEGHAVAWESALPAVAAEAVLGNDPMPPVVPGFNTDHYRALVPIYVAGILQHWLGSAYWAFALVDLLAWWISTCAFYPLARRLGCRPAEAVAATAFFVASPIAVQQLSMNTTHVASAVSLGPALLAALIVLGEEEQPVVRRAIGFALVLFAASLFYTYQWVVAPCMVALALLACRRRRWLAAALGGTLLFLGLTWVAQRWLGFAGIVVHAHQNDPVRLMQGQLAAWDAAGRPLNVVSTADRLLRLLVGAHHPLIFAAAVAGLVFGGSELRLLFVVGNLLGMSSALFYPVPWLVMHGYPFVYAAAGTSVVRGPEAALRLLSRLLGRSAGSTDPEQTWTWRQPRAWPAPQTVTAALLLLALASTNVDLIGNYGFVARWWEAAFALR